MNCWSEKSYTKWDRLGMEGYYSLMKLFKNQRAAHQMAEEVKALAVNCDCKSLITGRLSLWKDRKKPLRLSSGLHNILWHTHMKIDQSMLTF